ncbi:MAG: alginate lyase family protein [Acidimicrobiales bacterium]
MGDRSTAARAGALGGTSGGGAKLGGAKLAWYLKRLQKMSGPELAWRLSDQGRKFLWSFEQVPPVGPGRRAAGVMSLHRPGRGGAHPLGERRFRAVLPAGTLQAVPAEARRATVEAADAIMAGRWEVLGVLRTDMEAPDWFRDPVTGRRAPQGEYCFRVDHRREEVTGNVKQVWELSRLHHLTVLAAAFAFTGDERYALRAASHLRSWWRENPFLSGVHWTSGIEVGVRLVSWVWARRLLHGWPGAPALFEGNDDAVAQVGWHQRYLASFASRGSSANNHSIAEAAGQLVAALAFDWFAESGRWAADAAEALEAALASNTFPSGVNREMAFEYHGFVAELALVAAAEADLAGQPLSPGTWELAGRMLDVVAATLDARSRPPRYGDGDGGRALVLDPASDRWQDLLYLGATLLGAPGWWPEPRAGAASTCLGAMSSKHPLPERPTRRPAYFADAGVTLLRTPRLEKPEIWCRCDSGPQGFLSIAAHGHADALSVEVRYGGTEVLADPGTYCYHGEPGWRGYFRSTLAHNTLELGGRDQSDAGGPFLWATQARSRTIELRTGDDGEAYLWSGEHDGYERLSPPARHRRTVRLRGEDRLVEITDRVTTTGHHPWRLAFHLGPEVRAVMAGQAIELHWAQGEDATGETAGATLRLPVSGRWRLARGEVRPLVGWYSAGFGQKQPSVTVIGEGTCEGPLELATSLQFRP